MDKLIYIFLTLLTICYVSAKVKIEHLAVPPAIESGSKTYIILDCDFTKGNSDTDLEIKWYYNNDTTIIYQWIPKQHAPQAINKFEDKIDTTFQVTNDSDTMHRALYLKDVSPNLSGNYTCKVSSSQSEDVNTKQMIIYVPAKDGLNLFPVGNETVICSAYGIYPKPDVSLYIIDKNETKIAFGKAEYAFSEDESLFNVTDVLSFKPSLTEETAFSCELSIQGTDYFLTRNYTYYPEDSVDYDIDDSAMDYPFWLNFTNSTISENLEDNSSALASMSIALIPLLTWLCLYGQKMFLN